MALKAFISGCAGFALTDEERAYFRDARPCGLIVFQRNCDSPEQLRHLVEDFRARVATDRLLVLVDQEGGRVQRLRPPRWRAYPPARAFGRLYARRPAWALKAARASAHLMALDLAEAGINVDCAPVLDVPAQGAHDIIGDRAYGEDPDTVIALGRAVAEGLLDGGVLPVVKHVPGHGRARADSHRSLPRIDAPLEMLQAVDFRPFAALRDLPLAMTAHVLLPELDPMRPASTSPDIIGKVIRGAIGFDGLLMSDDVSMGALTGSIRDRSAGVFAAGADLVLHCNGEFAEMQAVAEAAPQLEGRARERFEAAFGRLHAPRALDRREAEAALAQAFAAA